MSGKCSVAQLRMLARQGGNTPHRTLFWAANKIERLSTELQQHQWRSIESAPRDGRDVLLAIPNPEGGPHMVKVGAYNRADDEWDAVFKASAAGVPEWQSGHAEPSHWRPKPPEPDQ